MRIANHWLTRGDSWSHAIRIAILGCLIGIGFNGASPAGVAWRLPTIPRTAPPAGSHSNSRIVEPATDDSMRWEHLEFRIAKAKAIAVDLRSADAYDRGHVLKAISFPLESLGADVDSPNWQTFRTRVNVHHFVVLYGDAQPTEAMRRFRKRLVRTFSAQK
jgi:hypothetical protein